MLPRGQFNENMHAFPVYGKNCCYQIMTVIHLVLVFCVAPGNLAQRVLIFRHINKCSCFGIYSLTIDWHHN